MRKSQRASLVLLAGMQIPFLANLAYAESSTTDLLARWGIQADLRLLGTDLFDGANLKTGYRYEVDPSYKFGLFTRLDRYYFNTSVDTNVIDERASEDDFGVGLEVRHLLEVDFARQFRTSKEALQAKPYFIQNIPLNSRKAIDNLKEGDMVSMKARLNIVVNAEFLNTLITSGQIAPINLVASAHYLIAGQFQIHVLRLPDNKIRLKIVGIRQKEKGVGVDLKYASTLKIFGVNYANRRITKLLDLNPVELKFNDGVNNLFMVDYLLDLKDSDVQGAYDTVLRRATQFESAQILNPRRTVDELRDKLVMDIASIEELFSADRSARRENPRVERSFRGSVQMDYRGFDAKLGVRVIRLEENRQVSQSRILNVNQNDQTEHYRMDTYRTRSENSFFFSLLKARRERSLNALYTTDSQYQQPEVENIILNVERRDKRFRPSELEQLKRQVQRTISPEQFAQIDFSKFETEGKINNVFSRYQVVLSPESIGVLPQLNRNEITRRYLDYLKTVPWKDIVSIGSISMGRELHDARQSDVQRFLGGRVQNLAKRIEFLLDPANDRNQRIDLLMELRNNSLFKYTGFGFLNSLLTPSEREKFTRFTLELESTDQLFLRYVSGNAELSDIYNKVTLIQNILNNDGLDVRLEAESISSQVLAQEAGPKEDDLKLD